MKKHYSITAARNQFAAIVHDLKPMQPVRITRRGKVVAVLISADECEHQTTAAADFWEAYERFRAEVDLAALQIEPDIFPNRSITDWQS